MKRDFSELLLRRAEKYPKDFSSENLFDKFIPYYKSGERIEVTFSSGEVKRGTVSVTTGWKPCFLLMLRRDSIGSSWTLGKNDKVTKIIR